VLGLISFWLDCIWRATRLGYGSGLRAVRREFSSADIVMLCMSVFGPEASVLGDEIEKDACKNRPGKYSANLPRCLRRW
jgi:hypothetical protein